MFAAGVILDNTYHDEAHFGIVFIQMGGELLTYSVLVDVECSSWSLIVRSIRSITSHQLIPVPISSRIEVYINLRSVYCCRYLQ